MKKPACIFGSITLLANLASAQVILEGLVAYYPFNGDANNQVADTGHGTVVGPVLTADKDGNPNSAFHFRGDEDNSEYIEFVDYGLDLPMGDTARTLAAWVKIGDLDLHNGHLISYGTTEDNQHCHLAMLPEVNSVRMGFWYNDIDIELGVLDTAWHHLAGVWDGTNVSIYYDGELKGTGAPESAVETTANETIQMRIGCINYAKNSDPFNGAIDEVMIFSRNLDSAEIGSIMSYDPTGVGRGKSPRIASFKLYQMPFHPITAVQFSLSHPGHTTLRILNAGGRRVETLVDANLDRGTHTLRFRADNLSTGAYFYQLRAGDDFVATKKLFHSNRP